MPKNHVTLNNKTILVTNSPGFIGANLVMRLLGTLTSGTVISLDDMSQYYDSSLKEWRLRQINKIISRWYRGRLENYYSTRYRYRGRLEKYYNTMPMKWSFKGSIVDYCNNSVAFRGEW